MAASSSAKIATILFSNPSSLSLENGRLFGSAQILNSRACEGPVIKAVVPSAQARANLRKAEHIQRSSLGSGFLQVLHRVDEAKRGGAVTRVEIAGHDCARPATDTREDGDVLTSVRPAVGGRLANDARPSLELPQG